MMDVDLLLCMLQLMRTLWIGAQFVVIDAHMASIGTCDDSTTSFVVEHLYW